MRTKRVNRYYCDFCKKSGCHAPSIRKHEQRCTMNPDRECKMCKLAENDQKPMSVLVAILPNPDNYLFKDEDSYLQFHTKFYEVLDMAMQTLRNVTNDCPACILAALRQARIPVPAVQGFDYKAECKDFFDELNHFAN